MKTEKDCSPLVHCTEDTEEFCSRKPHRRFDVWKGRDIWHKQLSVQVSLEDDGRVFLATQEVDVSTIRTATITIDELHALIRGVTASQPMKDKTTLTQRERDTESIRKALMDGHPNPDEFLEWLAEQPDDTVASSITKD